MSAQPQQISTSARYTPEGVRVEEFTDEQRTMAIAGALSDPRYLTKLNSTAIRRLRSDDRDEQTAGLISLSKFENLVFTHGVVKLDDRLDEAENLATITPIRPTPADYNIVLTDQEATYADRLAGIMEMPASILVKLSSPKPATVRKAIRLARAWMLERQRQQEAAAEAAAEATKVAELKQLEVVAYAAYDELTELISVAVTVERRAKLTSFLESIEDSLDDPAKLSRWIETSKVEIDRQMRKAMVDRRPAPAPSVNQAKQDSIPIGLPVPLTAKSPTDRANRGKSAARSGKKGR